MADLDFVIPSPAYTQQTGTLDFWIRDLNPTDAPVVDALSFSVREDAAIGTAVGTATATDPNGLSFTWSITAGNSGGAFAIDSATGAITTAAALDYTTHPSYALTVAATNTSALVGSNTQAITIIEIPVPVPAPDFLAATWTPWLEQLPPHDAAFRAPWQVAEQFDQMRRTPFTDAPERDHAVALPWQQFNPHNITVRLPWGPLQRAEARAALEWVNRMPTHDTAPICVWGEFIAKPMQALALDWRAPPSHDLSRVLPWADTDLYPLTGAWFDLPQVVLSGGGIVIEIKRRMDFQRPADVYTQPTAGVINFNVPLESAFDVLPPIDLYWRPVREPQTRPQARFSAFRLLFDMPGNKDRTADLIWGPGQPVQPHVGTPWHAQPAVDPSIPTFPSLGVYTVNNTLSVVRLPERTPVNVLGIQLNMDINSFAATASLTLAQQSDLDLLDPSVNGADDVEISVNGFVLVASMTSYKLSNAFGAVAWTISGSGRSVRLGPPYASPRSYTNTTLKSAAQLATDELSGSGWTLDWQVPDWNVDVGQFAYTNLTPIEAIAVLAKAAGGTVQADPANQIIHVISRYPVSPVAWATTTPSVEIPNDVMITLASDLKIAPTYNAIYISGGTQGVAINAKRAGTAGDQPLPAIVDPLILDSTVGQERARVEIDATGSRINRAIAMPIADPVGVVLPGAFIQAGAALGIVTATAIVAQLDTSSGAWDVQAQLNVETLP